MPVFRTLILGFGIAFASLTSSAQPATPTAPIANPVALPDPHKTESAPASTLSAPAPGGHALEKADLEAFFDGVVPLQLERNDIAGASVLVIKDGQVLLAKGYGYADEQSHTPVDPNSTIFRLASISKLFTWVSVMQLEEQGKLDLDTDINRYLDFEIKPAFNKPITLRNLMTHTGGFEDTSNDIILTNPIEAISLRDYLTRNQPRRIFPPGVIPGYSNYGVGLASYIVQRVSGEPFEKYVEEHIFQPLGMTHSSFYQPLPKALASTPSEGYREDTTKPPVGFEIFNPVGAGGLSSTAIDMGRFGQALLNGGVLDGQQILKPETMAAMWTPQFRATDQLPAQCMGFYQVWRNQLRWIGHEGDLIAFHSLFFVEPTQKLVYFVSYNSAGGGNQPRPEMINFFSDRYFPDGAHPAEIKAPLGDLKAIAGRYEPTRRTESTKAALLRLMSQYSATISKDGVLTIDGVKDLSGHVAKWKPIGKDLWYDQVSQRTIFGIRDGENRIARVAVEFPGLQMQRVLWYENGKLILPAVASSLFVFLLVVAATAIRWGRAIFFHSRLPLVPAPGTARLSWSPRAASFVWLLLLGSIGIFLAAKGDDLMPPTPAWFPWLMLINGVTAVALLLSLFAVLSAIRAWFRNQLRWISKLKFSIVGISCLILSFFALHWHLIGPAHRM